jgi:hypothetical protein
VIAHEIMSGSQDSAGVCGARRVPRAGLQRDGCMCTVAWLSIAVVFHRIITQHYQLFPELRK